MTESLTSAILKCAGIEKRHKVSRDQIYQTVTSADGEQIELLRGSQYNPADRKRRKKWEAQEYSRQQRERVSQKSTQFILKCANIEKRNYAGENPKKFKIDVTGKTDEEIHQIAAKLRKEKGEAVFITHKSTQFGDATYVFKEMADWNLEANEERGQREYERKRKTPAQNVAWGSSPPSQVMTGHQGSEPRQGKWESFLRQRYGVKRKPNHLEIYDPTQTHFKETRVNVEKVRRMREYPLNTIKDKRKKQSYLAASRALTERMAETPAPSGHRYLSEVSQLRTKYKSAKADVEKAWRHVPRPYLVYTRDGQFVASYSNSAEAERHAAQVGGRVKNSMSKSTGVSVEKIREMRDIGVYAHDSGEKWFDKDPPSREKMKARNKYNRELEAAKHRHNAELSQSRTNIGQAQDRERAKRELISQSKYKSTDFGEAIYKFPVIVSAVRRETL